MKRRIQHTWQFFKHSYVAILAFVKVLYSSDKAGVLIVYDAEKRNLDVYRHNLDVEGARDLTLLGLGALNQRLLQRAASRYFTNRTSINLN